METRYYLVSTYGRSRIDSVKTDEEAIQYATRLNGSSPEWAKPVRVVKEIKEIIWLPE